MICFIDVTKDKLALSACVRCTDYFLNIVLVHKLGDKTSEFLRIFSTGENLKIGEHRKLFKLVCFGISVIFGFSQTIKVSPCIYNVIVVAEIAERLSAFAVYLFSCSHNVGKYLCRAWLFC